MITIGFIDNSSTGELTYPSVEAGSTLQEVLQRLKPDATDGSRWAVTVDSVSQPLDYVVQPLNRVSVMAKKTTGG